MEDDTHIHNMCDGHSVPLHHQVLNDCKLILQNDKTPLYIFLYNLLFNDKKKHIFHFEVHQQFHKTINLQWETIFENHNNCVKESRVGMHNFVARPEILILICLLVPSSCARVKAPDTLSVLTKVLMVCCKI
jgi:hypothetical protein